MTKQELKQVEMEMPKAEVEIESVLLDFDFFDPVGVNLLAVLKKGSK